MLDSAQIAQSIKARVTAEADEFFGELFLSVSTPRQHPEDDTQQTIASMYPEGEEDVEPNAG